MADVFNKNPIDFVNMNDLFPVLNKKVGLTAEQWRIAIENTNYLYNHLGLADVEVGSVNTIFTSPGTLSNVIVTHREETINEKTIDYFDYTFYIPSPKIETSLTTEFVDNDVDMGMTLVTEPIYGGGIHSDVIVGYRFNFNAKLLKQPYTIMQLTEMPVPSEEYLDKIVAFVGETNDTYVKGDLYICHSWTNTSTAPPHTAQYFWVDLNNELRIMPKTAHGYENRIVRYIGETNQTYTYGKFYQWIDSGLSGGYGGTFIESKMYATADDIQNAIGNVSTLLGNTDDLEV